MNFFDKIFRNKAMRNISAVPSWETIVEMMYDKHLNGYAGEVVQVIYSKDKTKRYVILKDKKGFFTYQLETIYQYDPAEWQYIASNKDAIPAMWEPVHGVVGRSLFGEIEELVKEMKAEPEYKRHF